MRLHLLALLPAFALSIASVHCVGGTSQATSADGGASEAGGDDPLNADATGATTASKVDLLLVVDNSSSMSDKAKLLASSLGPLVRKVAETGDVHIGVVTSSLGTMGGDVCAESSNSLAHLSTVGAGNTELASAAQGFLSYGPATTTTVDRLLADAETLVQGVGEQGCGLEAQLESAYRFLVQPDPWQSVVLDANRVATLRGVDDVLLEQRKAFLRPDSLVVVVMLTDEDDSSADPRSVGGQGWAFMATQFPGSPVFRADGKTTTAPRATSICATDPGSPACTSCGFGKTCNSSDSACLAIRNDSECQTNGGYYGPNEDPLEIRFHRMKERFGIDPQFPLSRYVDGFTKQRAPDRDGEHLQSTSGSGTSTYRGAPTCTNPLFAATLPSAAGDELCNLPRGPRGKELVVFAVIGGVPNELVEPAPAWQKIVGRDQEAFDYQGIDLHMVQSQAPRAGLEPPTSIRGDNGTDPVHGRDYDTNGKDLQYACTFALPSSRTCTSSDASCDCASASTNPPLCGAALGQQVRMKAYPSPRPLLVAQKLGDSGVIGSICPTSSSVGYTPTMSALADRLSGRIAK